MLRLCVAVSETPVVGNTEVAKVDDVCVVVPLADPFAFVLDADADAVAEVLVLGNGPRLVFVRENSLFKDEIMLCILLVSKVSEAPVKPAP